MASLEGTPEITILARPESHDRLATELVGFFQQVEKRDAGRVDEVVRFLSHHGCNTASLLAHFGERLDSPCGHCTFCRTGEGVYPKSRGKLPRLPPRAYVEGFRAEHPEPLGDARATARFLFGFRSCEIEAAGLIDHPAFGLLRRHDFDAVLAWLTQPATSTASATRFEAFARGARDGVDERRKVAVSLEALRATRRKRSG